jgi:hypothetical protein
MESRDRAFVGARVRTSSTESFSVHKGVNQISKPNCYILVFTANFEISIQSSTSAEKFDKRIDLNYVLHQAASNYAYYPVSSTIIHSNSIPHNPEWNQERPGFTQDDQGYPKQLGQSIISSAWLDSLVFSGEADPFHADWPYWSQECTPLATAEP